jgi:prepilin-type N-terminal cleavage/methylation domain-containing protein
MTAQFFMPPKDRHRSSSQLRRCEGFTLIELLIGMAIFAIGTLAIAGLQAHSANTNAAATRQLEVEAHVGRLVELYKNMPWTDIDGDGLIDNVDLDGGTAVPVVDVLPVVDGDGDNINGIEDTGAAADYVFDAGSTGVFRPIRANDGSQVFVNIAPNVSVPNTLTINIIAQWTQRGRNRTYSVLFVKGRDA